MIYGHRRPPDPRAAVALGAGRGAAHTGMAVARRRTPLTPPPLAPAMIHPQTTLRNFVASLRRWSGPCGPGTQLFSSNLTRCLWLTSCWVCGPVTGRTCGRSLPPAGTWGTAFPRPAATGTSVTFIASLTPWRMHCLSLVSRGRGRPAPPRLGKRASAVVLRVRRG